MSINWQRARCAGMKITDHWDPWFLPEQMDHALAICNGGYTAGVGCPIREECLLYAQTHECRAGIWGGMSELARKALRLHKPEADWHWQTEEDALEGLDVAALIAEEESWADEGTR